MTALEFARRWVRFTETSPITGPFNDAKYPFVQNPLLSLSDIGVKTNVVYGPTQALKTVCLEIGIAYFLDILRASVLAVAQTDDDSKSFSQLKLTPLLESFESLCMSTKDTRHAKTVSQWVWPTHYLIISGPGENAQESKSVRFLCTDEAHRWGESNPGALTALENRMGGRWDRMAFHATTAAVLGSEIDILYHKGQQAEWHLRCPACDKLIWPLWTEQSRAHYNGHEVFQFKESQSEQETLDSIRMVCPHCDKAFEDGHHVRKEMDEGAQYVAMNADADGMYCSHRWNAFAPRWKAWRDLFARYLNAIYSLKLGDLLPYRDWITKQLVISWDNQYPMLGDSSRGRNYNVADVEAVPGELRTMSVDYQSGKNDEGKHWWVLVEQWKKNGDSRRIAYRKVFSWDEVRAMQVEFSVLDRHVGVDCGHEARDVFAACSRFHWLALKSGDEENFAHMLRTKSGMATPIYLPYSATRIESSIVGKEIQRNVQLPRGGSVPPGFAVSRLWSTRAINPLLYALKQGTTGREYGIARDFNPIFIDQLHSYIPVIEKDKKTGVERTTVWRKIKEADHGFACAAQGLVMAILGGFFPLAEGA